MYWLQCPPSLFYFATQLPSVGAEWCLGAAAPPCLLTHSADWRGAHSMSSEQEKLEEIARRRRGDDDHDHGDDVVIMYTLACPDASDEHKALPEQLNVSARPDGIELKDLREDKRSKTIKTHKRIKLLEWADIMDVRAAEGTGNGLMEYFEVAGKFGTMRFECENALQLRHEVILSW